MNNIEKRIDELMSRMTLTDKIGQLNGIAMNKTTDELKEHAKKGELGSLVAAFSAFAGHEGKEAEYELCVELQRIAMEESPMGIPIIMGRDVIHGHKTVFPIPLAQAATWNLDVVKKACKEAAKEAVSDCLHWTYTPMLDIARDPRWGRIIEGFGEDPYLCGQMAKASVEGYQSQNLAACAKHYIGYGASEGGRDYDNTEITEYTLRNIYLPSFKAAVEAGVQTVMSSFNDIGGEPVSASYRLLTEILKDELGFDGFVVGDWDVVGQLIIQGVAANAKEATMLAINAGLDMDNVSEMYIRYLPELVEEGLVPISRIDDAVRRVLRVKFRLRLFENPGAITETPPQNRELARDLATQSMVLLKNENDILPLPKENVTIAVVGPFAEERRAHLGAWTLDGQPKDVVTVLEGIRSAAPGANIIVPDSRLLDDMYTTIRKADCVVAVLGESHDRTGEARSVTDISLSHDQVHLLNEIQKLNTNIVTVICAGRPVALENINSQAILFAWHSGIEAGNAVGDILFGNVNPSGKLPVTFPRCTGQIPLYYNRRAAARYIHEYYDAPDEFANYQDSPGSPLYPFGHGLQYTSYLYEGIAVDKSEISLSESVTVSINVSNTGTRAGTEAVQCYLRAHRGSMVRPLRELCAFRKIMLNPGQSEKITFEITPRDMSFYNGVGEFVHEPGTFTLWVGGSCLATENITFTVKV